MADGDTSTSVSAKSLFESLNHEFAWNPAWGDPAEVAVVNIPISSFFAGPMTWGDLQSTTHAGLIRAMCWMGTNAELGTPYAVDGVPQDYYFAKDRPRTVQLFEPLLSDTDRAVVGIRLWFCVIDPSLSLQTGFHKLIVKNIEEARERSDLMKRARARAATGRRKNAHEIAYMSAAGTVGGGMTGAPERRIMNEMMLVNSILMPYLGRQQSYATGGASVDELYSSGALAPGSMYSPKAVLGEETAFSLHLDGVWQAQCEMSNYFDPSLGEGLCGWRGRVPDGAKIHRVLSQYFQPDLLCGTPLPHVLIRQLTPTYERFKTLSAELTALETEREEAEIVDNVAEARILTEDIQHTRARISYIIDEMDDQHEAIRRDAPTAALGTGTLSDSFNSSYIEETVIARNDLRKMHRPFTDRYAEINRAFDEAEAAARADSIARADVPDVTIEGATREVALQDVRSTMLDQFWRIFTTSERVTPTIGAMRKWFTNLRRRNGTASHWTRHFTSASNLTPFGNMIVRMTTDFGDALEVETNFQLMYLTLFVVMGSGRYKFGLRPNLIVTGEGGGGKSFSVEQAKAITIPGAILNLTHLTTHGMNGGDDVSDCCIIMEELPLDMIGIDKYGNTTAADPHLKARIASGISTTMSQDTSADAQSAGERKSRVFVSRCMVSHIFISNDMLPPVTTAIMQRFIPFVMRKLTRADTGGQDRTFDFDTMDDSLSLKEAREEVMHGAQLQHGYMFIWEKAIEAGAMPEVSIETAHIMCRWIFDELVKRGVPPAHRRHKQMLLDLCRLLTMYFAVDVEFLSEYGASRRAYATGKMPQGPRPNVDGVDRDLYDEQVRAAFEEGANMEFKPHMLEGLVKWGVVTQEIVIFTITLLEFLWVPRTRIDISRAAASLARMGVNAATGELTPVEGATIFRREEVDGGMGSMSLPPPPPPPRPQQQQQPDEDEEWSFHGFSELSDLPPEPRREKEVPHPSAGAHRPAQQQQQQQQQPQQHRSGPIQLTEEQRRNVAEIGARLRNAPTGVQTGADSGRRGGGGGSSSSAGAGASVSSGAGPPRVLLGGGGPVIDYRYIELVGQTSQEIAQKIRRTIANPPSENDVMSAISAMTADYIMAAPKHFVNGVLEDIPDAPKELIPCATVETLSERHTTRSHRRRVCLAVDTLKQSMGSVLTDSIKAAMCHKHQALRDCITAYPYITRETTTNKEGEELVEEAPMHHVFDTISLEARPNVQRYVLNTFGRTEYEINALLSRKSDLAKMSRSERKDIDVSQRPAFAVCDDLDATALLKYWMQHGVDIDAVGPAYTPHAAAIIKTLRARFPAIFPEDIKLEHYPDAWVQKANARRDKARRTAALNLEEHDADAMEPGEVPEWRVDNRSVKASHIARSISKMQKMRGSMVIINEDVADSAIGVAMRDEDEIQHPSSSIQRRRRAPEPPSEVDEEIAMGLFANACGAAERSSKRARLC